MSIKAIKEYFKSNNIKLNEVYRYKNGYREVLFIDSRHILKSVFASSYHNCYKKLITGRINILG